MKVHSGILLSGLIALTNAHGEPHSHGDANPNANYAQRHMATEHHIDAFNPSTFFQLHDLNRDSVLDRSEIEAIYGVHHVYSKRKTPTEEAQAAKAKQISDAVLAAMDTNKDGFITMGEFLAKGLDALPDFSSLGAEGHHYDVESEFFLHHEEIYHNTPETQTDASYNHPEDLEHFAHHEEIERVEAERERKFQGLAADGKHKAEGGAEPEVKPGPKYTYTRARKDEVKPGQQAEWQREAQGKDAWGTGESGYKRPREASDKLRKNLPYKVTVQDGQADRAEALLKVIQKHSTSDDEPGCLTYRVCRSGNDFFIFEEYRDGAAIQAHFETEGFKALVAEVGKGTLTVGGPKITYYQEV
ncbi:Calcium-binding protein [Ceratobasidium theobromae]|uniref:Calcium-binding protein n=1 Tax=Ceratobasidium theobromae TaxID=1582974 RepID=A0A5N5QRY3_9AGAM|nr:Calcium-binding protein [Ceratobasidium theobromae]